MRAYNGEIAVISELADGFDSVSLDVLDRERLTASAIAFRLRILDYETFAL